MPEIISSNFVYSSKCSSILFSSNRSGRIRPYIAKDTTKGPSIVEPLEIKIFDSSDFFGRDFSSDCDNVALVSDNGGNEQYKAYLFNRHSKKISQISNENLMDARNPIFSPSGQLVSYVSGNQIFINSTRTPVNTLNEMLLPSRILNYTWGKTDNEIYLQEESGRLSEFNLNSKENKTIWNIPRKSFSPTILRIASNNILFVSDHESIYSQIFSLDLKSLVAKRILPEDNDQSDPMQIDGKIFFKRHTKGLSCLTSLPTSSLLDINNCQGVTYNYSPGINKIMLAYSDFKSPISIYSQVGKIKPQELLGIKNAANLVPPIEIKLPSSPPSFLFMPKEKTNSLIVWIHGGPHEDVSPRYNPLIANLLFSKHAVLALNYPGSTGIGNNYELRNKEPKEMLKIQLDWIEQALSTFLKTHPEYTKIKIFSVSYGSTLAHLYRLKNPSLVDTIVDFSGKTEISQNMNEAITPKGTEKTFFIWGENDYFSQIPERKTFLKNYRSNIGTKELILAQEGHVIRNKNNLQKACDSIIEYLEASKD